MKKEISKLLVLSYYNPWISGGGHRPVCLLEEEIKKGRHIVFVYVSDSETDNISNFELAKNEKLMLVRFSFKDFCIIPENETALDKLQGIRNIFTLIDWWKPQFIRSHNPVREYIPVLEYAKSIGLPHIYDQMDYWRGFPVQPWGEDTEETYLCLATEIVTISYWLQRNTQTKKDLYVIPNGIKQSFLDELQCDDLNEVLENSRSEVKTVLYVGAIWPEWFDWDIVKYIVEKRPDYQFVFIGSFLANKEENDGRDVAQLVAKLSLNKNVTFLGQIPHHKLIPWLKKAHVGIIPFTMTPLIEACSPLKCYEYLAAYLPTVSTYLPEIDGFPSVNIVKDKEHFLYQIDACLSNERTMYDLVEIQDFIYGNTWERRVEEFDKIEVKAIERLGG